MSISTSLKRKNSCDLNFNNIEDQYPADEVMYQKFLNHWSSKSLDDVLNSEFIILAFDDQGEKDTENAVAHRLPLTDFTDGRIYVLPTYRLLYNKVYEMWLRKEEGVVVTGQSGIGKTLLLYFLLVCLIADGNKRPVAFRIGNKTVCFENRRASILPSETHLPNTVPTPTCCLIDSSDVMNQDTLGRLAGPDRTCFPVVTAHPGNKVYERVLVLQRGARVWWLPSMWTKHHLQAALPVQWMYRPLLAQLEESFETDQLVLRGNALFDEACTTAWRFASKVPADATPPQKAHHSLVLALEVFVDTYGPIPSLVYLAISGGRGLTRSKRSAVPERTALEVIPSLVDLPTSLCGRDHDRD